MAQYKIIIDYKDFVKLEDQWKALEDKDKSLPFVDYDFLKNWYLQIGKNKFCRLRIVIRYNEEDRAECIFPLMVAFYNAIPVITWFGDYHFSEFMDVVGHLEADELKAFYLESIDLIRKENLFLSLPEYYYHVGSDSKINKIFRNFRFNKNESFISYIDYRSYDSADDYLRKYNKKLYLDTLRQLKRLKKIGSVNIDYAKNTIEKIECMEFILKNKKKRYQRTKGKDVFKNHSRICFLESLIETNFEQINFEYLKVNNTMVAADMSFFNRKYYYYFMPTFDDSYKKYSPGRVLLLTTMNRMITDKRYFFNFGHGDELYKHKWTNDKYTVCDFYQGSALKLSLNIKKIIKKSIFFLSIFKGFFK